MKRAELLKNIPPQKPTKGKAVGNMFYVDKTPVLEIQWKNKSLIRHFVWKDNWATFRNGRWTKERLRHNWCFNHSIIVSKDGFIESQKLIADEREFLTRIKSGSISIEGYESQVSGNKARAAAARKEKRITKYARENTPPLPKNFIAWAKKQKAGYIYLLQPTANGGTIDRRFTVHGADYSFVEETVRGWSFAPGQNWDVYVYGQYWDRYGRNQVFYDKKPSYRPVNKKGVLYPYNLNEINMISEEATKALITEATCGEHLNFGRLYERIQRDDRAERIVKSGYKELIKLWRTNSIYLEQVGPRAGVHEMLGVSKGRYRLLRKWNAKRGIMEAARMTDEYFLPIFTDSELRELKKIKNQDSVGEIARIVAEIHLPIKHVIKLLEQEDIYDIRRYYDYLMMARRRGQDTSDEIVYRNKRWREFHDRWNAEEKIEKAQNRKKWANKAFKGIREKAAVNQEHFGWEYKGYVMIPAKKASEIIDEGCLQHHCVGSSDTYMERMANGQSFILFLRKKEDKETPYYTIEAEYDGTVKQAYGAYDRKPDWDEVDEVLKRWKKEVNKRIRREKENVVSGI